MDPLLVALMERIPQVGSEWPASERLRWFRAFVAATDLLYGEPGKITTVSVAEEAS